ncbi:unnamed protein product, partial [Leptidea sinapis]
MCCEGFKNYLFYKLRKYTCGLSQESDADMSLKQGSGTGKVHFGGLDDVSLYGTPVEPAPPAPDAKQGFLRNQLQALFQPTDNKLAMKLFGSKKALMKERIRQKAAGHWFVKPIFIPFVVEQSLISHRNMNSFENTEYIISNINP